MPVETFWVAIAGPTSSMIRDMSNSAGGTSKAFSDSNFVKTDGLQVNIFMPDQAVPVDGLG